MIVYLASPGTQQQAEHAEGMPVLLSFALWSRWLDRYQATFCRLLIDSGAFSEFSSGVKVDLAEYAEWAARWQGHADAVAGLDDISGDWRRSLKNYEDFPGGFPTFHETDPPELLDDLVALARERRQWLGLGLLPPRHGKERWVREACGRIPEDLHVHGWAMRAYTHVRRLDSVDSTNWWRDAMDIRRKLPWLTYGEALAIVVKRYQRWQRVIHEPVVGGMPSLFDDDQNADSGKQTDDKD
jgi:hypothetical protein